MSEEKKPKKDLRARLGRTIAPNTPGAPPIAAPGGVIAPPPVAAPTAAPSVGSGDDHPAVAAPVAAPAAPKAQPAIAAPPAMASRNAFGGADIAPPPFAKPAEAPKPSEPPKPRRPADPFAAGPSSAGPGEFRLVIDEKPVDDSEIGRRQRGRTFIVVAVCLVLGIVIGAGAGSMNGRRTLYNITVRDGHEIYNSVDAASRTVLEAQQHIEAVATSAGGGSGGTPAVNYTEIAALVALENPLAADTFSRKNYGAFQPGAVDDLFHYYQNVQRLWEHFQHLNAITAAPRRQALDATAVATGEAANAQYVAVMVPVPEDEGGGFVGQLAFAEPAMADGQPTAQILARGTRTGAGRPFDRWAPDVELGTAPTHVLLIDGAGSAGVLGERLGAFRGFVLALTEIRELMNQTIEIQGRLTTALGDIARLEEVTAF